MEPEVKIKSNIVKGIFAKFSLVIGELIENSEIKIDEASKKAELIEKQETGRVSELIKQIENTTNQKGKKEKGFVIKEARVSEEEAKKAVQKKNKIENKGIEKE